MIYEYRGQGLPYNHNRSVKDQLLEYLEQGRMTWKCMPVGLHIITFENDAFDNRNLDYTLQVYEAGHAQVLGRSRFGSLTMPIQRLDGLAEKIEMTPDKDMPIVTLNNQLQLFPLIGVDEEGNHLLWNAYVHARGRYSSTVHQVE